MKKIKLTEKTMNDIIKGVRAYDNMQVEDGNEDLCVIEIDNEKEFVCVWSCYEIFINKQTMEIGLGYDWDEKALMNIDENSINGILEYLEPWLC